LGIKSSNKINEQRQCSIMTRVPSCPNSCMKPVSIIVLRRSPQQTLSIEQPLVHIGFPSTLLVLIAFPCVALRTPPELFTGAPTDLSLWFESWHFNGFHSVEKDGAGGRVAADIKRTNFKVFGHVGFVSKLPAADWLKCRAE
jgi:hypothetical protein